MIRDGADCVTHSLSNSERCLGMGKLAPMRKAKKEQTYRCGRAGRYAGSDAAGITLPRSRAIFSISTRTSVGDVFQHAAWRLREGLMGSVGR